MYYIVCGEWNCRRNCLREYAGYLYLIIIIIIIISLLFAYSFVLELTRVTTSSEYFDNGRAMVQF
jgi:hypothetical protein